MSDAYEEIKRKAAEALDPIDPSKPLGAALFDAVARITPVVAIETVAIRERISRNLPEMEVFLTKRAPNDSTFAGYLHSPGSCLRRGENVEDVFRRLQEREFLASFTAEPRWYGEWNNPDGDPRGHTFHTMYLVEVETFSDENWFPIDKLPEPTISYHREIIIPRAVAAFNSPRADLPFAIVPVDLRYTETEYRDRFVRPKNVTVLLIKNERGEWDCPIRTWNFSGGETEHQVFHPRYVGAMSFDVRDYVGACSSLVRGELRWCRIYLCRRDDQRENHEGGQFFPVDNLPELISKDAKEKFIPAAVGHLNLLVAAID